MPCLNYRDMKANAGAFIPRLKTGAFPRQYHKVDIMRKYFVLMTVCMVLFSCTKPDVLKVSQSRVQFDELGGVVFVNVNSNVAWTARSSCSWCSVAKSSSPQDTEISVLEINCFANKEVMDRTCTITVSAGGLTDIIDVIQSEGKGVLIKKSSYCISSDAQDVVVEVEHNIPFSAVVSSDAQSWMSIVSDTKSLQESNLVLNVKQNCNNQERIGVVTIKTGYEDEYVFINQDAGKENANTANCYIVDMPGNHSFDAKYKGRTYIPVGTAKSAKVIWETCNGTAPVSAGCIISACSLDESTGTVNYYIPDGAPDGNAIIAVFSGENGSGDILWSWHIWFVERYDADECAERYPNGKVFMDRNLGALSNEKSDPQANGLLYQWGRKDPFAGKALIDGTMPITATSDFAFMAKFTSSDVYKTDVDYSIAHPTTFIGNWNDGGDGDLWSGSLAVYNPCPKGWTIPKGQKSGQYGSSQDDGDWSQISTSSFGNMNVKVGGAMYNDNSGKAVSWYPASGRRLSEDGNIEWYGNQSFFFWSQTIDYAFSGIISMSSYYFYYVSFGCYTQDNKYVKPSYGFSVRCVKE